jgi:hypothetical protein
MTVVVYEGRTLIGSITRIPNGYSAMDALERVISAF